MSRKAWNEAMRTAAAGVNILPSSLQPKQSRRSDRRRQQQRQRRDTARKRPDHHDDNRTYQAMVWLDALEGVDAALADWNGGGGGGGHGEEEYDELEELEGAKGGKKRGSKRKRPAKNSSAGGGAALPKRYKPRPLASILLGDEAHRWDGVAKEFIAAEDITTTARHPTPQTKNDRNTQRRRFLPPRKFCPVTGLPGIYQEPKSGIPYASPKALEQIQERAPTWWTISGTAAYYEATRSLQDTKGLYDNEGEVSNEKERQQRQQKQQETKI